MKERFIALFFICCLMVTAVGYQFAFRIQRSQHKTAMKRNLRKNRSRKEVVELAFDQKEAQQLNWEDEKEFSWKGRMYDVIEKRVEQDKLIIRCFPDKKEDKLLKAYQKATEKEQRQARAIWVKLMTAPFTPVDTWLPKPSLTVIKTVFTQTSFPITVRSIPVVTPPPDVC